MFLLTLTSDYPGLVAMFGISRVKEILVSKYEESITKETFPDKESDDTLTTLLKEYGETLLIENQKDASEITEEYLEDRLFFLLYKGDPKVYGRLSIREKEMLLTSLEKVVKQWKN